VAFEALEYLQKLDCRASLAMIKPCNPRECVDPLHKSGFRIKCGMTERKSSLRGFAKVVTAYLRVSEASHMSKIDGFQQRQPYRLDTFVSILMEMIPFEFTAS